MWPDHAKEVATDRSRRAPPGTGTNRTGSLVQGLGGQSGMLARDVGLGAPPIDYGETGDYLVDSVIAIAARLVDIARSSRVEGRAFLCKE